MKHLDHPVEDLAVCFNADIMKIDGAGSHDLPVSLIIFVFLDTQFDLQFEVFDLEIREIEHLELSELEPTSQVTLDMGSLNVKDGTGLGLGLHDLETSLLNF